MPVLVVKESGRPDRVVPLEESALVVGRGRDCAVRLEDSKVSGRHVRIRPLEAGGWVARDLGSTSGTFLGRGRRILRSRLAYGDTLTIGRTRLVFLAEAPPSEPADGLVKGTLDLRPVQERRGAEPPKPAIRAASPPAETAPPAEDRPARVLDRRLMSRAVALALVGLLVLLGVELVLRPGADLARSDADERRDLRRALEKVDISPETFEDEVHDFFAQYPDSRHREALEAYLAATRAREAERVRRESELNTYLLNLRGLPESEVRGALLDLARSLPDDEDVSLQIRLALDGLDRTHETRSEEALEAVLRAARARVAQQDPAAAMRRLSAFRVAWPALSSTALGRLRSVEDEAIRAVAALSEKALADAAATEDPAERRMILARAWRGLEGTPQGVRLADELRFTRGPSRPGGPAGAGPGATPPTEPLEPAAAPGVLAKAAEAEDLARARNWGEALTTLRGLITQVDEGPLRSEWAARIEELKDVVGLVERLAEAAAGEKPPKRKLPSGRVVVSAASPKGVTLQRGDATETVAWTDVPDEDLLPLLTPARPRDEDRLGLAVLAATMSLKDEFVGFLLPLFEEGKQPGDAGQLVARYLFGRSRPPPGGYRAYKGELLDKAGYERRLRTERIAALEEKAVETVARVRKEAVFRKLARLKALREELDKRRVHALLAIFNEKHYPYPANKQSAQYRAVQNEIDRRVAHAREIWDDKSKVKISRKGTLGRSLDTWDQTVLELEKLGKDSEDLKKMIAPYAVYVTGEPITIRDIFLNDAERRLFAYNRWVMDTYNPSRLGVATDAERQQTLVTNEYRMLLGFAVAVTPGPASYEAIDDDTVNKILDAGKVVGRPVPLYAVRIDDRLVHAARDHSLDMQKRGFFAHHAPPNPATGDPGTSPFDRMKTAGYQGLGASENIANGASSAEQAHWMWIHSSGHHRNVLSPWTDQGVGRAGRLWTQNYGSGGGRKPVIEQDVAEGAQ